MDIDDEYGKEMEVVGAKWQELFVAVRNRLDTEEVQCSVGVFSRVKLPVKSWYMQITMRLCGRRSRSCIVSACTAQG